MKKIILCTGLLIASATLHAQLFSVTESSANPAIVLDLKKNPIVDINSKLTVELDPRKLTSFLAQDKISDPQITARLNALIYILQNQEAILQQLKTPEPGQPVDAKQLNAVSNLMYDFFIKLKQYPDIRKTVDSLYSIYFKNGPTLDKSVYPNPQTYVVKNLSVITDRLVKAIQNDQGINTIKIQLAAFLTTKSERDRKVHIENFDNYSAGNYYEVPRWVSSFSQDDIKAFDQAGQLSSNLNTLIAGNYSALLKQIPDSLNAYSCFTKLISDVQVQMSRDTATVSAEIRDFINTANKQLQQLYTSMRDLQDQKNAGGANVLQQFNEVSSNFLELARDIPVSIQAAENKLSANLVQADAQLKVLIKEMNGCLTVLQSDVTLVKGIYTTVSTLLQPFQGTANSVQQITGNAYSLTLNHLPAKGYIDLKTTGKRENGDEIVIKLISQTLDDSNKNLPGLTLDAATIEMQQVSFYSESNISVILASPIGNSSDVTLKSQFQFAPAGSLLLKFGSRKSRLWNAVNPGIGFTLATPDFNLDGAPDVSYGGVLTLIHNIVSVGLAYNTKTSSSFWFFGLSLPFSTLGLPFGGNVQTQK